MDTNALLRRGRFALRGGVLLLLAVNALDVTTSLIPSPADQIVPVPPRPGWVWAAQAALMLPLLFAAWRRLPAARAWLKALPIPRPALVVLGAYFAVQLVHVALRLERYPFSPVAMFSSAMPPPRDDVVPLPACVVPGPDGIEVLSFLREGNPFFAQYGFGWDYKAGWAMRMYATTHSRARDLVLTVLRDEGRPGAGLMTVAYHRADGNLLVRRGAR